MKRKLLSLTLSLFALACGPAALDEGTALGSKESALITYTAPNLKWIMWRRDGSVALTKRDRNTGTLTTRRVWSFYSHWQAVGVAGNKLLWQRTDIDQASLWTIDDHGNYAGHRYLTPAWAGYRAVSISAVAEGCSALLPAYREYDVVYYQPGYYPYVQRVDNEGQLVGGPEIIYQYQWNYALRDFRKDTYGRWRTLWSDNAGNAVVIQINRSQSWTALRRDHYRVQPTSKDYQAPGNGFIATSFQTAQDTDSEVFGDNLLFSRDDGQAVIMSLNPLGEPYDEVFVTVPGSGSGWSADSLAGADRSELLCFTSTQPPFGPGSGY